MPTWHWQFFGLSLIASAFLTWAVRRFVLATKVGLSVPRARDVHRAPVPRLGGVAVALTFLIVTMGIAFIAPAELRFTPDTVWGLDRNLLGILIGVSVLAVVGIIDDIRGLSPLTKLVMHFIVGGILAASFVLVPYVTNPFGGQINLGVLSYLFVVLWVVLMINVINWLDGLDGLASGVSLIATLILYFLAIKPEVNQLSMSLMAVVLAGTLAGFLPFNFFPAKIFLGDSGSQVIGFLLAVFAIISGGKLATAFLVLGVPILDVVWVILRRLAARKPVYQADGFHLHHRLLRAGLSQKQAVLVFYTLSAAFGIVALQTGSYGKFLAALALIAIMILGGALLVLLGARRKEVNV